MRRAVVCVATTPMHQKGMARLELSKLIFLDSEFMAWDREPFGCPPHKERPYAFKAYAMECGLRNGADLILYCDSSIVPIRSMEPLWEQIERDGYLIINNGFSNYTWTADSAYKHLFPSHTLEDARELNKNIPHVVAGVIGLNLRSEIGAAFLKEYYRLASETDAFCGPWTNANAGPTPMVRYDGVRCAPCGPPDVLGHRHDQSAASVIAWRLGMKLTDPPIPFAYARTREDGTVHSEDQDQRTILMADGSCFN